MIDLPLIKEIIFELISKKKYVEDMIYRNISGDLFCIDIFSRDEMIEAILDNVKISTAKEMEEVERTIYETNFVYEVELLVAEYINESIAYKDKESYFGLR